MRKENKIIVYASSSSCVGDVGEYTMPLECGGAKSGDVGEYAVCSGDIIGDVGE